MDLKQLGNECFKRQDYEGALSYYGKALKAKPTDTNVLTNASMTCIKLQRWLDAKEYASRALSAQPQNIKALFRRGMAEAELNELDLARQDFCSVLRLEPRNESALKELQRLTTRDVAVVRVSEMPAQYRHIIANEPAPGLKETRTPEPDRAEQVQDKGVPVLEKSESVPLQPKSHGNGTRSTQSETVSQTTFPWGTSSLQLSRFLQEHASGLGLKGSLELLELSPGQLLQWFGPQSAGVEDSVVSAFVESAYNVLVAANYASRAAKVSAIMETLPKLRRFAIAKYWADQRMIQSVLDALESSLDPSQHRDLARQWLSR